MSWLSRKEPACPVAAPQRAAIEHYFLWLLAAFGKENTIARQVLVPDAHCFPIQYDGSKDSVLETLDIVARQMELDAASIELHFYNEGANAINTGRRIGQTLYLETGGRSGGMYQGKNEEGKFLIGLEVKLVNQPEKMVATMAHELAHVKLLGEERITENDELLTDLTTVLFGLGIFNANAAFSFKKDNTSFGYSRLGYLSQMEWGYALAIFGLMREADDLAWQKHLTPSVRNDMDMSMQYLLYANDEAADVFLNKLKNA